MKNTDKIIVFKIIQNNVIDWDHLLELKRREVLLLQDLLILEDLMHDLKQVKS